MFRKILLILLLIPSLAFAEQFVAGKDYQVLPGTDSQGKHGLVMEFFSFGCPWCYKIHQPLHQWEVKQGDKVNVQRVPVVFNPRWLIYAQAYYVVNALSKNYKVDDAVFNAIHEHKDKLDNSESMQAFLIKQGLDAEMVKSALTNSPSIELKVKHGNELMQQFQVNAVPAFVVNNHYKTDLEMAKSPERLFKILDYLLTL